MECNRDAISKKDVSIVGGGFFEQQARCRRRIVPTIVENGFSLLKGLGLEDQEHRRPHSLTISIRILCRELSGRRGF